MLPISFDHTERLGTSLSEIAFEKAGIIKPGVLSSPASLKNLCKSSGREPMTSVLLLFTVSNARRADVTWEEVSYSMESQVINVKGPGTFTKT